MHNSRRQTPDTRSMWSQQDTLHLCVSVCGGQEEEEEREVESLSSSYLSDELITRATVHWDAFVCTITQPWQTHTDTGCRRTYIACECSRTSTNYHAKAATPLLCHVETDCTVHTLYYNVLFFPTNCSSSLTARIIAILTSIISYINTPGPFLPCWPEFWRGVRNSPPEKFVTRASPLKMRDGEKRSRHILKGGLFSPQRWTSCGEENILNWIRGMFVYQDGCAAPGRGERSILRMYQPLMQHSLDIKGLGSRRVLFQSVEYSTWHHGQSAAEK